MKTIYSNQNDFIIDEPEISEEEAAENEANYESYFEWRIKNNLI